MKNTVPAVPLSIRVSKETRDQLDKLSDATHRTKSFLASEAIEHYLLIQTWQINSITEAVKKADRKDAKFFDHTRILEWVNDWDDQNKEDLVE